MIGYVGMKMNPPERAKDTSTAPKTFRKSVYVVLSLAEGGSKGAVHVRVTVVELDVVTHG